MRKTKVTQPSLFDQAIHEVIKLIQPEKALKIMDKILEKNPEILQRVHSDLVDQKTNTGSQGISAERVLRCAILKVYKRLSYRELARRLNDGVVFRWFSRFLSDPIPHYTTLQKSITHIKPHTWFRINEVLVAYSKNEQLENGYMLRVDTTVTETNIAYPLDCRLLNDSVRVLTRLMVQIKEQIPELNFSFADRTRRAKKRCYQIVMAKGRKAKRQRAKCYRDLIRVANEVFELGSACCEQLSNSKNFMAVPFYEQLDHYLTLSAVAIEQCERRVLRGEKVPASEKIVSLFEEHTDIIKRGKTQSPTEFGHKILVASGKSGLITQYQCFRGNPSDSDMLAEVIRQHKEQYVFAPRALAGDRRFFSSDNEEFAYEAGVNKVSICKPGYRSAQRKQIEKKRWFKKLQRYRAGIEGLISCLMRAYGLKRCLWKGWEAFQSYVGLSVVTFNLQKIAMLT